MKAHALKVSHNSYLFQTVVFPFFYTKNLHVLTKDGSIYGLWTDQSTDADDWTKLKDWEGEITDRGIDINFKVLHLKQN